MSESKHKSSSNAFDEKTGMSRRRSHNFDVFDQLDEKMGIAEAVSEAVVEEICQASLHMANASKSKPSNHRRLQRHLEEERSSSSEEPDGGRLNDNDVLADSETTEDQNSIKDEPHFFDTNFEDDVNASDIGSVVDTIEYYARSISGMSYLSDIGFEDLGDKGCFDIEQKVIQEYGMEFIKKFEMKMGNDEEPNDSSDGSNGYKSDEDGENMRETPLKRTTTATTAEILYDVIRAEREGEEVVYDPTKRQSSRIPLRQSLKSLGIVRSSSFLSSRKDTKSGVDKEIKIDPPQDALATRAAAVALASTLILDDIRQEEVDVKATGRNFVEIADTDTGTDIKDQATGKSDSNRERIKSRHSFTDTDAIEVPTESIIPRRSEKITIMVNTTEAQTESFTPGQYKQQNLEVIHNPSGPLIRLQSYDRHSSVKSLSSMGSSAYYDNKEVVYDPKAFSEASHNSRSLAMVRQNNSCCDLRSDLRSIATNHRTRSHQNRRKIEHRCSGSIHNELSISKNPRNFDDDYQQSTSSYDHPQSFPPTESHGIEMELMFDCLKSVPSTKNRKKKDRSFIRRPSDGKQRKHASKGGTESFTDETNRPSYRSDKSRFLDPERLFCGLKPPQPLRMKNGHLVVMGKKAMKVAKDNVSRNLKMNDSQPSKTEAPSDIVRVETINHLLDEDNSCGKEKAHNVSMETATTAATEDEDGLSQFQIEVEDISAMTLNISALLQETSATSRDNRHTSTIGDVRNPLSRESLSDPESEKCDDDTSVQFRGRTKIRVITEIKERDLAFLPQDVAEANSTISCPIPMLLEAHPDNVSDLMSCPVSVMQEEKPNSSGELVNLLHKISSYVDGIVEKNNYSLSLPSTQDHKKDGNEADDETSNPKMEALLEKNIVTGMSGVSPPKEQMLDAIYVPTNRTPKKADNFKTTQKDKTKKEKEADLLSMFEDSPIYSESSHSNHDEKSKKPIQSLIDDNLSDDSLVGRSVERSLTSKMSPEQQREECRELWEAENHVVYHMKSSPPKVNRTTQKRTTLRRTIERHPSRLQKGVRERSALEQKAKSFDEDVDMFSVGSLPYRCIKNPTPKGSLARGEIPKRTATQKENRPSQPPTPTPESAIRKDSPSYRERRRPPTPPKNFREEPTQTKTELDRLNVVPASTGVTTQATCHDGKETERETKTCTQSNGFIVDENGFLLDRTNSLLEDLDKSADILEDLGRGNDAASFQTHESIPKLVLRGEEESFFVENPSRVTASSTPRVDSRLAATNGDRSRRSTRSQLSTASDSHHRTPLELKNLFAAGAPEPVWKSLASTDQLLQTRDSAVHSRFRGGEQVQ